MNAGSSGRKRDRDSDGEAEGSNQPSKAPAAETKTKKRPACDSCKLRRVLCHPVLPPGSCPRCAEKKIICTTTPVVRKKPVGRTGRRIEEAKAIFGSTEAAGKKERERQAQAEPPVHHEHHHSGSSLESSLSPAPVEVKSYPARVQFEQHPVNAVPPAQQHLSVSRLDHDSLLGLSRLSGDLAAHLLDLFQHTPDAFFPLPLLARNRLCAQFESVGRRLDCLPPQIEVLANVIMALTSRLSSHPLIIGLGIAAPDYQTITSMPILSPSIELREFGRRRDSMCAQFKVNAQRLMWDRGVTVMAGEENAASCHLMDVLEMREGIVTVRPYAAAFVANVTAMADDVDEGGNCRLSSGGLHWSPFMMQEALAAESQARASFFTPMCQLTICGEPPSVDVALSESVVGLDIRNVMQLFYMPMQAFTHGVTNLARDASEKIVGTHARLAYARNQDFDEQHLAKWIASFDKLHALLSILLLRINDQLSPAAVTAFSQPPALERERTFVLHACRYTLPIAWASTILPVYREMERRVHSTRLEGDETSRRQGERLALLFAQVKRGTTMASRIVARCVTDPPTYGHLTHLHFLRVDEWAKFVAELPCFEEGGDGLLRADKLTDVAIYIAALKRTEFAWSHHASLIDNLCQVHQQLQLQDLLQSYNEAPRAPLAPPQSSGFTPFIQTPSSFAASNDDPFSAYAGISMEGMMEQPLYGMSGQRSAGTTWGAGSPGWNLGGTTHSMRNWSTE